jgi:sulfoxide reductase catalytic subunit YedY
MLIRRRRGWEISERQATPESFFLDRRGFLAGLGGVALIGASVLRAEAPATVRPEIARLYPARRNRKFRLDRPVTPEEVATTYNNYYEFGDDKKSPAAAAQRLTTRPWTVEIAGLVEKPFVIDRDDLVRRMPIEERLYRHRCVEGWSIAVPWTGFPLKALVDLARPLSSARYLRTVSFKRPSEAPAQLEPWYPFPYFEAFRLDEARNVVAFVTIGMYGRELSKQNGQPLSIRMPWKYGFKSPKGIVRLEFTGEQPPTFWGSLSPNEYGFLSNVNPAVGHPRWSQETEKFFGPAGVEQRPTIPYNGYGEWVADMYDEASRRRLS